MSAGVFRAATVFACVSFAVAPPLTGGASHAQSAQAATPSTQAPQVSAQPRPVTGFVSAYEILRTVRSAGFEPLAPPLREGTTYVLRATDYRGILMRVVLDARTGVIRDVTRIVPGESGPYGAMLPAYAEPYAPPYGAPSYGPPPYGPSAGYQTLPAEPPQMEGMPTQIIRPAEPPAAHPATEARGLPPLPRPRPAALIAQDAEKSPPQARGDANALGANAGAAQAPAAPSRNPPPAPLND